MAFKNQVSSFVQSFPDDLWRISPMNQLVWLKYFKDLKPNHGFFSWLVTHFNPNTTVFRFEDSEVTPTYEEMCSVMDHHPEQDETPALPPGPRYDLSKIVTLCKVLPEGYRPSHHQLQCSSSRLSHVVASLSSRQIKLHSSGPSSFDSNLWSCQFSVLNSRTLRFWG
ncbi:hypothetical protein JCGZ_00499 [Jatropha curcas]|uniref:Uncharacterized protein n=1 Tax=Jatropha curcas TaxID=180498 RepID=A0A067JGM5_JATCU|nr:hypothetical protein JCGZ_00499 [Jatropha curcas]